MYPVTRPAIPDPTRFAHYIERANSRAILTNFGPLEQELTARLEAFLGVDNLLLTSNGTIALQIAYRVLGVKGRAITTPFSFVASVSTLRWEGIEPVFADIDSETLNLDPRAAAAIDGEIGGIVAVHVYGNPCDVQSLERLAHERKVPIVYDAAHAFGSRHGHASVFRWGDAATLSFHATKIFHTVEGGGIVFRDAAARGEARAIANFGLRESGVIRGIGTNAKLSEYHAAAGLAVLERIDELIERRRSAIAAYREGLDGWVEFQRWDDAGEPNGAYMPILLADDARCRRLRDGLAERGVGTRRYFHPSLNRIDAGIPAQSCPIAEDISARVLCLPLYSDIGMDDVSRIVEQVKSVLAEEPGR